MTQLWLINPDPDWPGFPTKPSDEGWIWVCGELDTITRFPGYPTLEIIAAADGHYPAIHETLFAYGPNRGLLGIGGWSSAGMGSVYALAKRGGAWVREVPDPEWACSPDVN